MEVLGFKKIEFSLNQEQGNGSKEVAKMKTSGEEANQEKGIDATLERDANDNKVLLCLCPGIESRHLGLLSPPFAAVYCQKVLCELRHKTPKVSGSDVRRPGGSSPPFCSLALFLPIPTFKSLVGSWKWPLPVPFLKVRLSPFREPQLSQQKNSTRKIIEPGQVQLSCGFWDSDIWGPSQVTSFGFNYFVTFIDEYSRCTWVYLMKERFELLSILMFFSREVENQFGKIIKILRSDNAK
ncbi:hypothetical protein CR513_38394, partial [Mucuna pruriens]